MNADDFGFTRDVNEGIVHCHRQGILTATTLMANGDAFDHAVAAARETPTLDVGCHLVLIGGRSLLSAQRYPASIADLVKALARRQIQPYEELRAQVDRIIKAQIVPLHLDTHKHTHLLLPVVLEAVARLSEEYKIPFVRRPFDLPSGESVTLKRRLLARVLTFLRRRRIDATLQLHHCRSTDHFAGFSLTGYVTAERLVALIAGLPHGSTELMVHPGFLGAELAAARTRLKRTRLVELEALTDSSVREALTEHEVTLTRYGDL